LLELAECKTLEEVEHEVSMLGYPYYFTEDDLERILRVAFKTHNKYLGI